MENPNEYNDQLYMQAWDALRQGIGLFWDAGATFENIQTEFDLAMENLEEEVT